MLRLVSWMVQEYNLLMAANTPDPQILWHIFFNTFLFVVNSLVYFLIFFKTFPFVVKGVLNDPDLAAK